MLIYQDPKGEDVPWMFNTWGGMYICHLGKLHHIYFFNTVVGLFFLLLCRPCFKDFHAFGSFLGYAKIADATLFTIASLQPRWRFAFGHMVKYSLLSRLAKLSKTQHFFPGLPSISSNTVHQQPQVVSIRRLVSRTWKKPWISLQRRWLNLGQKNPPQNFWSPKKRGELGFETHHFFSKNLWCC